MIFRHYLVNNLLYILIFLFITNCQLQKNTNKHGILFLENRFNKLTIGKSNINDTLRIVGVPHTKSIKDKMTWIYFERVLIKGRFIKLGQNVVKENNVLVLTFNKFGILEDKNFFNKEKLADIRFTKEITENNLSQKSFVQEFLQSLRTKMYRNR